MTYQRALLYDRHAQTALSVPGLCQPQLRELGDYLIEMDAKRIASKGRAMTPDHLKQEAVKWARNALRRQDF